MWNWLLMLHAVVRRRVFPLNETVDSFVLVVLEAGQ
jgi:hypothetical protein